MVKYIRGDKNMGIGNRINQLRKENNLSQEYIAERLGVSRQAVYKWEKEQTAPDTENLIKLAELFSVSVEYLATGKTEQPIVIYKAPEKKHFKIKKKHIISAVAVFAVCVVAALAVHISRLPVEYDTGACSGGYGTFIFDKYNDELAEKFIKCSSRKDDIVSVKPVRGTHSAKWKDRNIFLQFDIVCEYRNEGTVTETVRFVGNRYWIDTFKWGSAIIVS